VYQIYGKYAIFLGFIFYQWLIDRLLDVYGRDDDSEFWANLTLQIVRNYHEHGAVHDDSVLIAPVSDDKIVISKNYLSFKSSWQKASELQAPKVSVSMLAIGAPLLLLQRRINFLSGRYTSRHISNVSRCPTAYQIPKPRILDTSSFCDYKLPPDTTVFTSEDYGLPFSRFLGCAHQLVDRDRIRVPTSGTAVRGNASQQWENISNPVSLVVAHCECCSLINRSTFLDAVWYVRVVLHAILSFPQLRGYYAMRFVLVGAESTGKSTLTSILAQRYQTTLVR
jgi:hypothetical protein